MEPAAPAPPRSVLPWILGVGIILALALAGWCFWQWTIVRHVEQTVVVSPPPKVEPVPAPPVAQALPPPAPVAIVVPKIASVPKVPSILSNAVPAPPPWPADLKLKGIFYNASNPRVLINDETLTVGESIQGVRITKIEQDRVTLEWNGHTRILMMDGL
jgi:hypothetical protein